LWKIALILWENRSTTTRCAIAEPISELYLRGSGDADHHTRHFWCFWLTIQNITNRHVSNAFDLLAVFISFSLACFPGGYPTDFHCASSVGYHVAPSSISCARSLFWEGCCSAAVPKNKTSSGVDTLICVCTRKATGSTEDSCEGTQPKNPVGRGRH